MTKKRKQTLEETIKFLEEKKIEYSQEISKYNRMLAQDNLDWDEANKVCNERKAWVKLYEEAEAALLYIKTAIIFAD